MHRAERKKGMSSSSLKCRDEGATKSQIELVITSVRGPHPDWDIYSGAIFLGASLSLLNAHSILKSCVVAPIDIQYKAEDMNYEFPNCDYISSLI